MSWPLASLVVLVLALAAGGAWYDRSAPSSRTLALVATLAALAALGRVAFAALPDVKPTTDIVLISGYALGGAPGFVIGAVAALVSNLFFGQGPWTPWQMVAWGSAGVVGAAAARLSARRLDRLGLAVVCAGMGLAFGAIMNLFTWTDSGAQNASQYAVIAGQALPFDLAHAAGNLLFALAFGPTLVRMLARFRARLEIIWLPMPGAAPALALACVLALGAGGLAVVASARGAGGDPAITRALGYLHRAQNPDGGVGGAPRQSSSDLFSGWAAMGAAAGGARPADLRRSGRSLADFVAASAGHMHAIGDLERTILALSASGISAGPGGGHDLVSRLLGHRSGDGSFGEQVNYTSFAILALRSTGRSARDPVLHSAARWLARQEDHDRGFGFGTRGASSDVDDTAAAVQALIAAGQRSGAPVARAIGFIVSHQNPDGGFPLAPGAESNAQSTAWAVQGLVATGRDPDSVHRGGGRSPMGYLRSLQQSDGSVRYSPTSAQTPVWVTAQALTALARAPFPIRAPVRGQGGRSSRPSGRAPGASRGRAHGRRRHHAHAAGSRAGGRPWPPAQVSAWVRGAGVLTGLMLGPLGA